MGTEDMFKVAENSSDDNTIASDKQITVTASDNNDNLSEETFDNEKLLLLTPTISMILISTKLHMILLMVLLPSYQRKPSQI